MWNQEFGLLQVKLEKSEFLISHSFTFEESACEQMPWRVSKADWLYFYRIHSYRERARGRARSSVSTSLFKVFFLAGKANYFVTSSLFFLSEKAFFANLTPKVLFFLPAASPVAFSQLFFPHPCTWLFSRSICEENQGRKFPSITVCTLRKQFLTICCTCPIPSFPPKTRTDFVQWPAASTKY